MKQPDNEGEDSGAWGFNEPGTTRARDQGGESSVYGGGTFYLNVNG